jgi:hypothetical protein
MAFQYGTTLRNNQVSQIQTSVGGSGTLLIYTGTEPANCGATATGSLLATIVLPATFLTSSGGATTIANGPWSVAASGTGTAGYFRMLDGSSVCHVQGNVTTDLVLNNTSITAGQTVSVTTFSVTAGNQ